MVDVIDRKEKQAGRVDHDEIIKAVLDHIPDGRVRDCAVCGEDNWGIDDSFAAVDTTRDPDRLGTRESRDFYFPLVSLVCGTCGNTHFLNAKVLGLTD